MQHLAVTSRLTARSASKRVRALSLLFALGLGACASGTTGSPVAPAESGLRRAASCEDLLSQLRADAEAKVSAEAERLLADYDMYRDGDILGWPRPGFDSGGPPVGAPNAPEDDGAGDGPDDFTETNTQVAGVDEPDFVKTDGGRIFLIHGQSVHALRSWPAADTEETGSADVEGSPISMFLRDDTLVVFSSVQFADPDGGSQPPIAYLPFPADSWGPFYPMNYREFTKVSLFDVSGDAPVLTGERYVEGSYRAGRRHDEVVRLVVRSDTWQPQWSGEYPSYWNDHGDLVGEAAFGRQVAAWRAARLSEIGSRDLDGWLPEEWVREGSELVAIAPRCTDYFAPAPGQTDYGMTQVLALSLDDEQGGLSRSAFVLGDASVVYANHEALIIAQADWQWSGWSPWGGAVSTRLHRFDLSDATTSYAASGRVSGQLLNQFSLDESDGVVRAAVTEDRWVDGRGNVIEPTDDQPWGDGTVVTASPVSRVVTLGNAGGKLSELGRSHDLAPGERIFSTRYVGDTAYVVTFRQTDPLFVLDLSDPEHVVVQGEVEIPGFSTYMHPLDPTHLLTIGRDVDPVTQQDLGMALQIFDVSDPNAPVRTHLHTVPSAYSQAQYDHLAFNYDARLGLLAIPLDTYDTTFDSSLALFSVSLDSGIAPAGSISHSAFYSGCVSGEDYYCEYSPTVRRGLFIEDFVYTISLGGVTVHALTDLSSTLASVNLPEPQWYVGYYGEDRAF